MKKAAMSAPLRQSLTSIHAEMPKCISRRSFLQGIAAFAAGRAFAAPPGVFSVGAPLLSFAAISDIHVTVQKPSPKYGTKVFEHALKWYRAQGVDAVVITGDLADKGLTEELEMVGAAWRKVFPENKGVDGRPVEKVFITGNHDHDACNYGTFAKELHPDPADFEAHKLANHYPECWESSFGERYAPISMKTIKGYRFISSHWEKGDLRQFGPRLKKFLAKHRDELSGEKPFFYLQHPHPKGTVYGPTFAKGVCDDGTVKEALAAFPNAVSFSGHSHWAITDERAIWQGEFTAVNLGCLMRTGFCRTKNALGGYENWRTPGARKRNEAALAADGSKTMPHYGPSFVCHHGSLVKVFADRIVIERREFTHDRPVADDWIIPLPVAASRPFSYDVREKAAVAPEFPPDARLTITESTAMNRKKGKVPVVVLSFPAANAVKGARPYDYLIEISGRNGEKLSRSVLAQGVELGLDSPAATGPSKCVLARDTLPAGPLEFSVRPGECFGALGHALTGRL